MELVKKITQGPYTDLLATLTRSLAQYGHYYRHVKVGITADPTRRSYEHAADGWQRMVVRYQTSSRDVANGIEKHFIRSRHELKNKWTGFSHMTKDGPYYVYFLLKTKRRLP